MINDDNVKQYIADNEGQGKYLLKEPMDGSGIYIAKWDMDIPKPTQQQLVDAAVIVAFNNAYEPSDLEIRLRALEDKAGINQGDKSAARQALIDAKA